MIRLLSKQTSSDGLITTFSLQIINIEVRLSDKDKITSTVTSLVKHEKIQLYLQPVFDRASGVTRFLAPGASNHNTWP